MQPELERLSHAWINAWLAKDVAAIEARMAPEYTYIAPNGQVLDRERILAIVRSPSYRLDRATRSEVHITRFKDSAILVSRVRSRLRWADATKRDVRAPRAGNSDLLARSMR